MKLNCSFCLHLSRISHFVTSLLHGLQCNQRLCTWLDQLTQLIAIIDARCTPQLLRCPRQLALYNLYCLAGGRRLLWLPPRECRRNRWKYWADLRPVCRLWLDRLSKCVVSVWPDWRREATVTSQQWHCGQPLRTVTGIKGLVTWGDIAGRDDFGMDCPIVTLCCGAAGNWETPGGVGRVEGMVGLFLSKSPPGLFCCFLLHGSWVQGCNHMICKFKNKRCVCKQLLFQIGALSVVGCNEVHLLRYIT